MTRVTKRLVSTAAALLLAGSAVVGSAAAADLREPEYRPYIAEVGPPKALTRAQFDKEVVVNSDLRSWVRNYGYPDVAEYQRVVPEYGWSDYEIRLYYFERDQELAFGRVAFSPYAAPGPMIGDIGLTKYQGRIQSENLERVSRAPRLCGGGRDSGALDRLLAAADRAAAAAELAEKESLRALQSAERAEAAVGRMDAGFRTGLRK